MGLKTRGNYTTGGWCRRRARCKNDGKCSKCYKESMYARRDKG